MKKVGIIGGAGFIGSHITRKFLNEGFLVKVSTTDIFNKEKFAHLRKLSNKGKLRITELHVENESVLKEFISDCEIVIHCGTPFQLGGENPQQDVFEPTVRGTQNFLNVVAKSRSVKKVVFLASVAALNTNFPLPADNRPHDHVYSEADEPYLNPEAIPYAQGKYYADQMVRKFISENPKPGFDIVSVSPVLVVGKALSGRTDSASVGLQYLVKNKLTTDPFVEMLFANDMELAIVSVIDVAKAIFNAATTAGLHGKNYLLASESWKISDVSRMLNERPPKGDSRTVYSNALAVKDLAIQFQPAYVPLHEYF